MTSVPTPVTVTPLPTTTMPVTEVPTTTIPTPPPTVSPTTVPPATVAPTTPTSIPTTISPTITATAAPTTTATTMMCDGLTPIQRDALINIYVRQISSPDDVDTEGTPQNLATEWIINQDPLQLCPTDPNLVERYVMAVFYYSTLGNRWYECSSQDSSEDCTIEVSPLSSTSTNATTTMVISGSDPWLSEASVCTWGGLACDSTTSKIVQIEMGKLVIYLPSSLFL